MRFSKGDKVSVTGIDEYWTGTVRGESHRGNVIVEYDKEYQDNLPCTFGYAHPSAVELI